jgi:hypothetical protein
MLAIVGKPQSYGGGLERRDVIKLGSATGLLSLADAFRARGRSAALVTGGGLKAGQLIGATDARGESVTGKPYSVSNMLSTIYRAIGIDPATSFVNASGRPIALLDQREPLAELL